MPDYPISPSDWQSWIEIHLGISPHDGVKLCESDSFPIGDLIGKWNEEFTVENGYVPDFIPALVRNKFGLLHWVYLGANEPNWRASD